MAQTVLQNVAGFPVTVEAWPFFYALRRVGQKIKERKGRHGI